LIPFDSHPLLGAPIAVIDFETDSPDPAIASPVQVAIAHFEWGLSEPRIAFETLIHPPDPIPQEATEIHGISNDAILGAPEFHEVFHEIQKNLEGRVLCAYNLPYEYQILRRLMPKRIDMYGLDPLVWVNIVDKYEKKKKLVFACEKRKIELRAHDAAGDALATARLMPILLEELTLGNRDRWGKKQGPWLEVPEEGLTIGGLITWTIWQALEQATDFAEYCEKKERPKPRNDWAVLIPGALAFQNKPKLFIWGDDGPEKSRQERNDAVGSVPVTEGGKESPPEAEKGDGMQGRLRDGPALHL